MDEYLVQIQSRYHDFVKRTWRQKDGSNLKAKGLSIIGY